MNIILVSEHLAKARTINIGIRQIAVMGVGLVVSVFVLAVALWYLHVKLTKVENKITECEQDRLKLWEKIAQLHN